MEETKKDLKNLENKQEVHKLSAPATVILSIAAALGGIVLFRILYFFITGQ